MTTFEMILLVIYWITTIGYMLYHGVDLDSSVRRITVEVILAPILAPFVFGGRLRMTV